MIEQEKSENTFDLRNLPNQEIREILEKELQSESVFHGSNHAEQILELEARQANDTDRESGSRKAVYASCDVEACIFKATFNKKFMQSKLDSFTVGWSGSKDHLFIKADPEAYKIMKSNYDKIFVDGWLYTFAMSDFKLSEETDSEYYSLENQKPKKSFRVPGKFAKEYFYFEKNQESTIVQYTQEEMRKINKHIEKQNV